MDKIWKYLTIGLMVALVALAGYGYFTLRAKDKENAKLRDEIASRDVTIQLKDGTYTKLAREMDDLKATNAELQKVIDKQKQDVITAQQVAATWKKKYDDLATLVPVPFPYKPDDWKPMGPSACKDVAEESLAIKDYGLVKAGCRILTFDPQVQARTLLEPGSRPLKLNLAVTRDAQKQWRSYVKIEPPDDQNLSVDIVSTAVNMEPLKLRWYENIGVHMDFGVGSGVLGGAGINYEFGQFRLGPSIWGVATTDKSGVFYGINFDWSPFKSTSP
jgi:Tfp pilus assembly protein PilN